LPAGTTVLHIGDSFAGALGISLNEELKRAGVKGVLKYKTASFIPNWAFQEKVPLMMLRYQPDLVLISLGANELELVDPHTRAPAIRRLIKALEGRPCVWIAPPLWAGETGLLDVIKDNLGPCRYMDSTALVPDLPRAKDRIHPSMDARPLWAKVVIDWLARERCLDCERPWALKGERPRGDQPVQSSYIDTQPFRQH
jgi:lysophospholipase L1-like esterase